MIGDIRRFCFTRDKIAVHLRILVKAAIKRIQNAKQVFFRHDTDHAPLPVYDRRPTDLFFAQKTLDIPVRRPDRDRENLRLHDVLYTHIIQVSGNE